MFKTRVVCPQRPSCTNPWANSHLYVSLCLSGIRLPFVGCLFIYCLRVSCRPANCLLCVCMPTLSRLSAICSISMSSLFICLSTLSTVCLFPVCLIIDCCMMSVVCLHTAGCSCYLSAFCQPAYSLCYVSVCCIYVICCLPTIFRLSIFCLSAICQLFVSCLSAICCRSVC